MTGRYPSRLALPGSAVGCGRLRAVAVSVTNLWRTPDVVVGPDAPMLSSIPDVTAWTAALSDGDRLALNGRLDTQLLAGEPVEVVDERDGWSEVRALWQPSHLALEGYPGWVRSAHLGDPVTVPDPSDLVCVVARGASVALADTGSGDGERLELSYGTVLCADAAATESATTPAGHVAVRLSGDRLAYLPASAVRRQGAPYDPAALVEAARTFLGLGYLWGGLSSWGTDCSGLVHLTHRTLGWVVPRDADDQCSISTRRDGAGRLGDLYFFSRNGAPVHHVGYVTDDARLLHAPGTGIGVEEVEMSEQRAATSIGARQFSP